MDEAHVYAPQQGEAESLGAVIDLATRGRKRGYCAVLATQRLSKLHKDAAAELNNKLIGRTGLDVDIKRAADELGLVGRDAGRQLRERKPGQFFAFGPAFGTGVTEVIIGDIRTTHPKAGARIAFTPPKPTAAIRALLPKLADLPAEAEARQRSLDDLTRENTTLKRQLATRPVPVVATPKGPKVVKVPILSPATITRLEKALLRASGVTEALRVAVLLKPPATERDRAVLTVKKETTYGSIPQMELTALTRRPKGALFGPSTEDRTLGKAERKILMALAQYPLGRSKKQVAVLTGYAHKGGGFNNALSALRTASLMSGSDTLQITPTGLDALGDYEPLPAGVDLRTHWYSQLGKAEREALAHLVAIYPEALSKEELAERAGYTAKGGGFNNALSRLRTLELIEGRGELRASEELF